MIRVMTKERITNLPDVVDVTLNRISIRINGHLYSFSDTINKYGVMSERYGTHQTSDINISYYTLGSDWIPKEFIEEIKE